MSAAEKLKTLDFGTTVDDSEVISMGYEALLALRDALPQIVAVVEAAEQVAIQGKLANALAALDEQLGDVT